MTERPRVDILNFSFYDWDGERVLAGGAERYVLELARVIGALGAQPQIIQNANRYFYNVYRDVPVLGVPAGASMDLFAMSAGFNDAVKGAALVIASPLELASNLRCDAPISASITACIGTFPTTDPTCTTRRATGASSRRSAIA